MPIRWEGEGLDERGYHSETGELLVEVDPAFFRPTDVECLVGDYSKAQQRLGWKPEVDFKELVRLMVEHDLSETQRLVCLRESGYDPHREEEAIKP
jgi:GDPmannose 4,6-dehydratase